MAKKIEKMHKLFGVTEGHICRDCDHLLRYRHHDRMVTKCEVYGDTRSEASDFSGRYDACGLWNEPYKGDVPIIRLNMRDDEDKQIEGQLSIEDLGGLNE